MVHEKQDGRGCLPPVFDCGNFSAADGHGVLRQTILRPHGTWFVIVF